MSLTASLLQTSILAFVTYLATVVIRFVLSTRRPKNFPPGPPVLLGLGNLHQIPLAKSYLKFQEWAKTYGDIIGLKTGPGNLVILSNPSDIRELLDKRGAIYSDRPLAFIPYMGVLGPQDRHSHVLFLQNNNYLRQLRTAIRYLVSPKGLDQMMPLQSAEAASLVFKLLDQPEAFLQHVQYWSLGTPLLAISGQRLDKLGDEFIKEFFTVQLKWLEFLTPGATPPVDILPFLRWVPSFLASWKREVRHVRDTMCKYYLSMLESAKNECKERESSHQTTEKFESLMAKILREQADMLEGERGFTDREVAFLGGAMLDAAVDTTTATTLSCLLLFASYPEVLKRAQREIDEICGDRQPQGEDLPKLVYLNAFLMEAYRFRPAAPTALPHKLAEDDVFKGYHFLKDTTFIVNVLSLHLDEASYSQPYTFRPERFLENPYGTSISAEQAESEGRRATYNFGSGRRGCPGEAFAHNAILIVMAKIIAAFDLSAEGLLDTSIETGYHRGLVMGPEHFKIGFHLRRKGERDGVVRDYEASRVVLDRLVGSV